MSDLQKNEIIKVVMYFDNKTYYEVRTDSNTTKSIQNLHMSDSEALMSGNPIGVISSNSLDLTIYDANGLLNINNENSYYYGYMRNGVEILVSISEDGVEFKPYGTYYVDDWSNEFNDITGKLAYIHASDKLQYIGGLDIPKLDVTAGITIKELITNVFLAIGLKSNEFEISDGLNVNLLYGVSIGTKVRDFLNQICQALLARVNVGKDNIIKIKEAISLNDNTWTLDDMDILSITLKHNENNTYNRVRITYPKIGDGVLDNLVELNGISLNAGNNKFNNLEFTEKAFNIEQVVVEVPDGVNISQINWTGYQNGLDLTVYSDTSTNNCSIKVIGRKMSGVLTSKESAIDEADTKIADVLDMYNDIISDDTQAINIVEMLAYYLRVTNKVLEIESALTPMAECGDMLIINSDNKEINGNYKIIESDTTFGLGVYNKKIKLVSTFEF